MLGCHGYRLARYIPGSVNEIGNNPEDLNLNNNYFILYGVGSATPRSNALVVHNTGPGNPRATAVTVNPVTDNQNALVSSVGRGQIVGYGRGKFYRMGVALLTVSMHCLFSKTVNKIHGKYLPNEIDLKTVTLFCGWGWLFIIT